MSQIVLNKKGRLIEVISAIFLVLIGVSLRLLPNAPNFAPIAAIALFSGVYLSRKTALVLPLAAMAVSDIFLGYYEPKLMVAVYGSFLLSVVLGFWLKNHKRWPLILGGSLAGSLMFFFITNLAVWAFTPWYSKTLAGIIQCYEMALPFFRNTLIADLFYAVLFFGAFELAEIMIKKKFNATRKNGCLIDKPTLV
jgi:hypothetical protein